MRSSRNAQSFHFQKIAVRKKNENVQNPSSYIKKQLPRRKFEIKSCLVFFLQKLSKQFLFCTGENKFSSVFAF